MKDCKGSGDEKHFHTYLYVVRIMETRDVLEKSRAETQTMDHISICIMSIICFIACCYGVARFILQNKQATTLWSGSRDLYRV